MLYMEYCYHEESAELDFSVTESSNVLDSMHHSEIVAIPIREMQVESDVSAESELCMELNYLSVSAELEF